MGQSHRQAKRSAHFGGLSGRQRRRIYSSGRLNFVQRQRHGHKVFQPQPRRPDAVNPDGCRPCIQKPSGQIRFGGTAHAPFHPPQNRNAQGNRSRRIKRGGLSKAYLTRYAPVLTTHRRMPAVVMNRPVFSGQFFEISFSIHTTSPSQNLCMPKRPRGLPIFC